MNIEKRVLNYQEENQEKNPDYNFKQDKGKKRATKEKHTFFCKLLKTRNMRSIQTTLLARMI